MLVLKRLKMPNYDEENQLSWLAVDQQSCIVSRFVENSDPVRKSYIPDGPAVNTSWRMTFSGNKLLLLQEEGGSSEYLREGMVMIFEEGKWKKYFRT